MPKKNPRQQQKPKQRKQKQQGPQLSNPRSYKGSTQPRPRRTTPTSQATMSRCAAKYALAISDPFHPNSQKACIPVYPSTPSFKCAILTRFSMAIGTAGVGFVVVTPSLANNLPSFYYTTSLYTQTALNPLSANNTLSAGVARGNMNGPYPQSSFALAGGAAVLTGRIVSAGVRVSYTGTTMNESGTYSCYVSNDHTNVITQCIDAGGVNAIRDADVLNITRRPCSIAMFSVDDSETEYPSANLAANGQGLYYPYSGNHQNINGGFTDTVLGINIGSPIGLIQVTGVAGSSFLCEYIVHLEYAGVGAYQLATPTEADQRGFEMVSAAAMQLPQRKQSSPTSSPFKLLMDGVKDVASALRPIVISKIATAGAAMLL